MSSPTQRTLQQYRDSGYHVEVVEKWNPHARLRQDLYGFIDLLAFNGDEIVGVQATSTGNMQARVKKILALPAARDWLACPSRKIIVIGWKKYKKPLDRRYWRPTEIEITRGDFGDLPRPEDG